MQSTVMTSGQSRKGRVAVAVIIAVIIALLQAGALMGVSPARADSLSASLDIGANAHDIVIDAAGTYGYATTCDYGGIPAGIYRIDLATFTVDDSMALTSDCGRAVQVVNDTIFVTTSDRLYRFDANTFGTATDDSVAVDDYGNALAISGSFAYIAHHAGSSSDKLTKIDISGASMSVVSSFASGGSYPMSIEVNPADGHAYVVHTNSDTLSKIDLATDTVVATTAIGNQSYGLRLDPAGSHAYIPAAMPDAGQSSPWLVRVDLATFTWDDTVDLPFQWGFDIALTPDGAFGYVGESRSGNPGRIAKVSLGSSMTVVETINSNPGSHALAVDPTGTFVYSADYNDHNQTTISKIEITGGAPRVTGLSVSTGPVTGGDTTVISGRNFTGVTGVQFGATPATILSNTDDTIEVTVPAASGIGAVNVTVTTPIATSTQTVTYTYAPLPVADDPQPPASASAPGAPVAQARGTSAIVRWAAPESTGSFPVSTYLVRSTPGDRVCLTSELTCEVTGLEAGVDYTFTVLALTGAGWSAVSEPSNAVTPTAPTITITGERTGKRLLITGEVSGLDPGTSLTPWTIRPGRATIKGRPVVIDDDGTFTWSRRASNKVTWRIHITAGNGVRSNVLTFP